MNFKLSNIIQHPPSTVLGFLVAITIAAPILEKADLAHISAGAIIGLVGSVASALMGAFYGKTADQGGSNGSGPMAVCLLFVLMLCPVVMAQDQPVMPTNLYAAGASYNVGGSPAVAGTALYAHLLTSTDANTGQVTNTGTYIFSAFDALPSSIKPFNVTTNVGAGIAQKIATIGKVPIYIPTAAGISWKGTNTGWQWNTGAIASIKIKDGYYIMPLVRLVKSSVSDGSGYQPIVGVLFGWGK